MNLSNEFRELELESECHVFVKGKHPVLVCELSTRHCVCKRSSSGPTFAKGVLPGTLHLQTGILRYYTCKVRHNLCSPKAQLNWSTLQTRICCRAKHISSERFMPCLLFGGRKKCRHGKIASQSGGAGGVEVSAIFSRALSS